MNNLTHLVFDCETLGIRENAVVLSIACVPFEFENYQSYSELYKRGVTVKFNAEEQMIKYGRVTDRDTIQWWLQQDPEVRKAVIFPSEQDFTMEGGLGFLSKFIHSIVDYNYKESFVWSRGTNFDFPKIESMYRQSKKSPPFNTWKTRDIRTFIDILCGRNDGKYTLQRGKPDGFKKHNALADAVYDAAAMVEIYNAILST